MHGRSPVRGVVLRDLTGGARARGIEGSVVRIEAKSCTSVSANFRDHSISACIPPPPENVWTWSEISPGSMIGSRRPTPVCERQGMRQKAQTLLTSASASAVRVACDRIVADRSTMGVK